MHSPQKSQGQGFAFKFSQKSFQKDQPWHNGWGKKSTTTLHIQQARETFQSKSQTPTSPSS
jgi:hypothetical protein